MRPGPAGQPQEFGFEFDNFDAFNQAIRGWSTDFRQVDRGTASVSLRHRMTAQINALDVQFSHSTKSFGSTQPGHRTFGMVGGTAGCTWCGSEVSQHQILRFDAHEEFDTFTPARFVGRTLSIEENLLDLMASRMGFDGFVERLDCSDDILALDPRAAQLFRRAYDAPMQNLADLHSIVEQLIIAMETARGDSIPPPVRGQARYVDAGLSFIIEHARDAITVASVCEALGVSYRTLDRAFRERLGHGPKESIMAIRLNGVRQSLQAGDTGIGVADVANSWGFWHMGDFARVYRSEFGELPSETLARFSPGV